MPPNRRKTRNTRNTRRRKQHKEAAPWIWMLFGLGLGLSVAVVVYITRPGAGAPSTATASTQRAPQSRPTPDAAQKTKPAPSSEKPKPATNAKPTTEFDFYKILPEAQVVPPSTQKAEANPAPAAVRSAGTYILQAGSFTKNSQADRLKARIALLGIESNIQKVRVNDETYHRVEIGPLTDLDKLNQIRDQLREHDIPSLVIQTDE